MQSFMIRETKVLLFHEESELESNFFSLTVFSSQSESSLACFSLLLNNFAGHTVSENTCELMYVFGRPLSLHVGKSQWLSAGCGSH